MSEEQLNELLKEYLQTVYDLEMEVHNVNEEIDRLTEIKDCLAKPYQDKIINLEMKIRLPMLDRKQTFVCQYGKINFRKGATTRKWNLNALDQICEAKPEIKEQIWAFREVKIGEPTITIKIEE